MTAPPVEREIQTDPRCHTGSPRPEALGEVRLHPDVVGLCRELGFTRPSKQVWLQRKYDALMADAVNGLDHGAVLTMLRRSGSVPVDRMGERITRRLAR